MQPQIIFGSEDYWWSVVWDLSIDLHEIQFFGSYLLHDGNDLTPELFDMIECRKRNIDNNSNGSTGVAVN